jgi:hypothetical protein
MWAEVGHYAPAVGPYGVVIVALIPLIAILGTVVIVLLVGKSRLPEGTVRIRILGISVRWVQSDKRIDGPPGSMPASPDKEKNK